LAARYLVGRMVGMFRSHGLNPKLFLALFLLQISIRALFYLPQVEAGKLPSLIALRLLALAGPLYIMVKGKRIAPVLNLSLILGWSLKTAWEVCYFVYL